MLDTISGAGPKHKFLMRGSVRGVMLPVNLVLLDIDGTLTDTCEVDSECYVEAMASVFGIDDFPTEWSQYAQATDAYLTRTIVHSRLGRFPTADEIITLKTRFKDRLESALDASPERCEPIMGGPEFLRWIEDSADYSAALATGGWTPTAELKLRRAGYEPTRIPMASSEDHDVRSEICALAVSRAAKSLGIDMFNSITYVGDGVWDVRAAQELQIDFIGIARDAKADQLRSAGAGKIWEDFASAKPWAEQIG